MKVVACLLIVLLVVFAALVPPPVVAQDNTVRVTIVALDQSGSMVEGERSDPLGMRCSAVRLLGDLATTRDQLSLVRFPARNDPTAAEVLQPPLAMGQSTARDTFKQQVDCSQPDGSTPMDDALQRASEQLDAFAASHGTFEGRVLLLTDGIPAPDTEARTQTIKDQLLPQFESRGWAISTVGLGLNAGDQLLEQLASQTGGTYYPVTDTLTLQSVFVDFFSKLTGRTLSSVKNGAAFNLEASGEEPINVSEFTSRISVLVSKADKDAQITLLRPDGTRVTGGGFGVELVSDNDPFYAAFVINNPIQGNWRVQTNRTTMVIVNQLVESNFRIQMEESRSRQPNSGSLLIEARIWEDQDGDGTYNPTNLAGATINATVSIQSSAGQLPPQRLTLQDQGNGLYKGETSLDTRSTIATRAEVRFEAQRGDNRYLGSGTITFVPVPTVVVKDNPLRLPPDAPIELPLYLMLGQSQSKPPDWGLVVRQKDGKALALREERDRFVVTLPQLPQGRDTYDLEAEVIGSGQNQDFHLTQLLLPVKLIYQSVPFLDKPAGTILPVGRQITLKGALLERFRQPQTSTTQLPLAVQRDNGSAILIEGHRDASGYFTYVYTPLDPGGYTFLLRSPEDTTISTTQQVDFESVPEVRWDKNLLANRQHQLIQWFWLDGLRKIPVLNWLTWPFKKYQSEALRIEGDLLRDSRPFSSTAMLSLLDNDPQSPPILSRRLPTNGKIDIDLPVPAGRHRLETTIEHVFPPEVDCCSAMPLSLEVIAVAPPLLDQALVVTILVCELLVLLALVLAVRWYLSPRPQLGDRLVFQVNGQTKTVDLRAAQRRAWLHPSYIDLSSFLRRMPNAQLWQRQAKVRMTREAGVQFNTQTIMEKSPKTIYGVTISYQPSRNRSRPRRSRVKNGATFESKRSAKPRSRASRPYKRHSGLLESIFGLFKRSSGRSKTSRRPKRR